MDQQLDTAFEKLLGRAPSSEEREKLFRVKDALGISTSSPLWLLFVVLGHYEKLYEDIPAKSEQAAQAAREAADAEIKRVGAHADRIRATALDRLAPELLKIVERNLSQRERLNTARMALAVVGTQLAYTAVVVGVAALARGDRSLLEMAARSEPGLLASLVFSLSAGALVLAASIGILAAITLIRAKTQYLGPLKFEKRQRIPTKIQRRTPATTMQLGKHKKTPRVKRKAL